MKVQIIVEHKGNEITYTLNDEKRYPYIVLVTQTAYNHFEATGGFLKPDDDFVVSRVLHSKVFKTAMGAERAAVKFLTARFSDGDIDVELVHAGTPAKKLRFADYT